MSEQLITWIRRVAALNDLDLEEELKLINKNSLNVFARVISHIHHPELDSHTYRNGTIKVLTRRITIYKSELSGKNRLMVHYQNICKLDNSLDKTWLPWKDDFQIKKNSMTTL
ncbi:hypothetical protein BDEG_25790 [Batrachochytrium dendrobatidis JEL423]|uniref:Uncharacterized protein n=1 Tax=Batrachochytrium dendrobatidis (strain JEL423) TaxID=403673 RepID=A0A177WRP5_BATDL|nr:hypothetical protein BDEG_25790 [Batrachochytrium dendrobatidis JEL423]